MISIIKNADGTIKTYSEKPDTRENLMPGETLELVDYSFIEYSRRLTLTAFGRSGETVRVARDSGDITVEVNCPGEISLALDINGVKETLPLIDGKAALILSTQVAGTFLIRPADRAKFCAAGQAVLMVEVA
jgi:hypothetical protein